MNIVSFLFKYFPVFFFNLFHFFNMFCIPFKHGELRRVLHFVCWLGLLILSEIRVGVFVLVLFQMLTRRLSFFCLWVLHWVWVCHKWLLLCWDMFPLGFPGDSDDKEFACGAVDLGPPWGREGLRGGDECHRGRSEADGWKMLRCSDDFQCHVAWGPQERRTQSRGVPQGFSPYSNYFIYMYFDP